MSAFVKVYSNILYYAKITLLVHFSTDSQHKITIETTNTSYQGVSCSSLMATAGWE